MYPYFQGSAPIELEQRGSTTGSGADATTTAYAWSHSLGEVVTALIDAGLRIEFLHEFPYSVYPHTPFLKEAEPGRYRLKDCLNQLPLMFSVKATPWGRRIADTAVIDARDK